MAFRTMLRGKIHRATVTEANVDYVGSLTVDNDLLRAADILPYEQVLVVNLRTGARLETYAIEGEAGSGVICANGAAAHLIHPGDLVIVMSYHLVDDREAAEVEPQVVFVDAANRIVDIAHAIHPG
ncbi:MAG: aspartate 1-decarboxylase [Chloroflexi bacterium HGW-Chloroflexi-9]|nr:MAG: aspartate 1-decarboxylase [Chloroflexi bacterium HGW-Chloroflexi-9]